MTRLKEARGGSGGEGFKISPSKEEARDGGRRRHGAHFRRAVPPRAGPISVNITSEQQGEKTAKFVAPWRDLDRDNCMRFFAPDCNSIAVRTGAISGILVVDFDNTSERGADEAEGGSIVNGMEALEMWSLRYGPDLHTWTAKTGKEGIHLYYRYPGAGAAYGLGNRAGISIEGREHAVDIRGDGGVIFASGSSYQACDGRTLRYKWVRHPRDTPLLDVPPWLEEVLVENDRSGGSHARQRGGRGAPARGLSTPSRLPGAPNAPFRLYRMQDVPFCADNKTLGPGPPGRSWTRRMPPQRAWTRPP
jgi:hypothetical protein